MASAAFSSSPSFSFSSGTGNDVVGHFADADVDLASVVKRLIDCSIQAGARTIDVRLFNYGLDIVEVSDDGHGIPHKLRAGIASPNSRPNNPTAAAAAVESNRSFAATIRALAASSKRLFVATRCAGDERCGEKLEYGRDGRLREATPYAKNCGTSVAVVKYMEGFPIQRKALRERIHAHSYNIFTMMQAYAILCLEISFNLIEVDGQRRQKVKLHTPPGVSTIAGTVSSVLGTHFLSGLSSLELDVPSHLGKDGTGKGEVTVKGFVSKASLRSSRNFQFYSVNGRPVDLPILAKALNKEWASVGMSQYPAAVLQLTMPPCGRDSYSILKLLCTLAAKAAAALWRSQTEELELCQAFPINSSSPLSRSTTLMTPEIDNRFVNTSPRRRAQRRMAFVHDLDNAMIPDETVHVVSPVSKGKSVKVSSSSSSSSQPLQPNGSEGSHDLATSDTVITTPKRTISSLDLCNQLPVDNCKKQKLMDPIAS